MSCSYEAAGDSEGEEFRQGLFFLAIQDSPTQGCNRGMPLIFIISILLDTGARRSYNQHADSKCRPRFRRCSRSRVASRRALIQKAHHAEREPDPEPLHPRTSPTPPKSTQGRGAHLHEVASGGTARETKHALRGRRVPPTPARTTPGGPIPNTWDGRLNLRLNPQSEPTAGISKPPARLIPHFPSSRLPNAL